MSRDQRHQIFLARAQAVGVSVEVAEAELSSVAAEVFNPAVAISCGWDEVYAIAWRRLIGGGPRYRPSDEVRTALRSAYPNAHPDWVDQIAMQTAPDETLAKGLLDGDERQ